jgi:hypothetical protein
VGNILMVKAMCSKCARLADVGLFVSDVDAIKEQIRNGVAGVCTCGQTVKATVFNTWHLTVGGRCGPVVEVGD